MIDRSPPVATMDAIAASILALDEAMVDDANWGERALFFNPGRRFKKGRYIATFKLRDGTNDRASELGQDGAHFRFNIGLAPADYSARFGPKPMRPPAGGVVATGHDFAARGVWMPHPVYAWMRWIAVIDPPVTMIPEITEWAARAIQRAAKR